MLQYKQSNGLSGLRENDDDDDDGDDIIQGGAIKTGPPAILSHCKYSENSMTELHGNLWTYAILYAEHRH